MELKNVNKKLKINWMIGRIILLLIMLVGFICSIVFIPKDIMGLYISLVILEGLLVLLQLTYTFVFPKLQYERYLYLVKDDEVVFSRGVIFIDNCVIPMVQIQDVGFSQGPIQLILGLATLEISTAGSDHVIAGFTKEEAEKLTNQIKEQIKLLVNNKNKGE